MKHCPVCADALLRHIDHNGRLYWFCSHCWQVCPNFDDLVVGHSSTIGTLASSLERCLDLMPVPLLSSVSH